MYHEKTNFAMLVLSIKPTILYNMISKRKDEPNGYHSTNHNRNK